MNEWMNEINSPVGAGLALHDQTQFTHLEQKTETSI
jgi:hypothetical protein